MTVEVFNSHAPTSPCFQTNFCLWCTIIAGSLTVWAFRSDRIPNWEFPQCSAVYIQQILKSSLLSLFCSPDSATSLQLLFIELILNCLIFPINQTCESEPETKEFGIFQEWCVCLVNYDLSSEGVCSGGQSDIKS